MMMVDRVAQKAEVVGDRPAAAGTTRLARTDPVHDLGESASIGEHGAMGDLHAGEVRSALAGGSADGTACHWLLLWS
ncbi:hypothetical protein [Gordonia paraffinivorans]|uniref:hypothetical protein n=1 Tax=Gordonia paraffinivorans TaxID=175628 RepID=UPI0028996FFB|nr:hypothetical protein [Gordonia paraffinivorans]